MAENGVIRKSLSFQPDVLATVESACKDSGLPFSTQVDQIIREWVEAQRLLLISRSMEAGAITASEAVEQIGRVVGIGAGNGGRNVFNG
jgi:hypothetical protein